MSLEQRKLAIAVWTVLVALMSGIVSAGENLFLNSGFEEPVNQSVDWRLQQWAGSEPDAFVIDETEKHEGSKSLRITHQNTNTYSVAFQRINVQPDTWYLLSGYAKADRDLSSDAGLPAKFFVINDVQGDPILGFKPIISTQWQEISFIFNSQDAVQILAMCYLNQKAATIWCDKMSISKVDGPTISIEKTEILADGTDSSQISVNWPELGNLATATKIRLVGRGADQITPADYDLGNGQSAASFTLSSTAAGAVTLRFEAYSDKVAFDAGNYGEVQWFWWEPPLTASLAFNFSAVAEDNLLRNPGFEDEENTAWSEEQWSGSEPGAFVYDTVEKYEGAKSLKIVHQNTDTYSLSRQGVDVEANSWYLLTGYVKSSVDLTADPWPPAKLSVDTTSGGRLAAKPIVNAQWQEISIVFNSGTNTRVVVVTSLYQRALAIWCDKLSLTKLAGPAVDLEKTEVAANGVDTCQITIDWPELGDLAASTRVRLVGRGADLIAPAEHTLGNGQSTAAFTVSSIEAGAVTLTFEAYSDEVESGWWQPPLTAPISLTFVPAGGGELGDNLLLNPSFEDDTAWALQQWSGSEPEAFVFDEIEAYGGAKSLKIDHKKADTFSLAIQGVDVEPNTWYLLTGYAKSSVDLSADPWGPAKFYIDTVQGRTLALVPIVSTQWQQLNIVFNTGDNARVRIICYLHQRAITVWYDQLSFTKISGPAIALGKRELYADGVDASNISVSWPEFGKLAMETKIRLQGREEDLITPEEIVLGNNQSTASFSMTSTKTGAVTLKFEAYSPEASDSGTTWFWWEPPLATVPTLTVLSTAADPEKSIVESDFTSRPAGGEAYPVTVSVRTKRSDGEIVSGQLVSLSRKSGPEVLISPASAPTGSDGWAHFTVTSTKAGVLILEARVKESESSQIILEQTATIEFTHVVDLKESELRFPAASMVADGQSSYTVEVILKDGEQKPVTNRKVSLTSLPGSFFELLPAFGNTDENGEAVFTIKTAVPSPIPVRGTLLAEVDPDEVNGTSYRLEKSMVFTGQVVSALEPANGAEDVRGQAAFRLGFHNPVQLQSGLTKIKVSPTSGSAGNTIEEIYSPDLANWRLQGNLLVWQHASLLPDVWYTARIEKLKNENGEIEPIVWEFKVMVDLVSPAVSKINGYLDVEPRPWEAQVSLNPQVKVNFTEELLLDGQGRPVNLLIEVEDEQGEVLAGELIDDLAYDLVTNQLSFTLSNLTANTTYAISLSNAVDLANLVMEPATWSFRTIAGAEVTLELIKWESQNNSFGEPKVRTDLKFYFNKALRSEPLPEIIVTEKEGAAAAGTTTFIDYLGTKGLQFSFAGPLQYDTAYEVTFSNVADLNGNLFAETVTFTTEVRGSEEKEVTESGGTYSFTLTNHQGNVAQIAIHLPAGALPSGTRLQVRNIKRSELELYQGGVFNSQLSLLPAIYEFVAFNDDEILSGDFAAPVTISIPYWDNGTGKVLGLNDELLPEESLRIFWWDLRNQQWRPTGGSVDTLANIVSVKVDHFSVFGLMGTASRPEEFLSGVALSTNPLLPGSAQRGETVFEFQLAYDSKVTLVIYDSRGKVVAKLLDEVVYPAGPPNGYLWDGKVDGRRLRPGIYIYRLFAFSVDEAQSDNGWVSGTLGIIW